MSLKSSFSKRGNKNPMFGRRHSPETRDKMRRNGKNHFPRGSKHPNWKGGVTEAKKIIMGSSEYKLWRRAVKERDGFKCLWCGSEENLHADHIKPFRDYPELRFAIDNGRTLCHDCHKTTDSYGRN